MFIQCQTWMGTRPVNRQEERRFYNVREQIALCQSSFIMRKRHINSRRKNAIELVLCRWLLYDQSWVSFDESRCIHVSPCHGPRGVAPVAL